MTSFTHCSPYVGEPLGPQRTCIRLLTLERGDSDDLIRCTLRAADTQLDRDYEALSYTWGDTMNTATILLNGSEFDATKNLIVALKHLRLPAKDRILWVDALCINQSDDAERNERVQYMGDVYARARRVLVWLGEAVPCSDLNKEVKDPTSEAKDFLLKTVELSEAGILKWDTLKSNGFSIGSYMESTGGFLRSPWFNRLWVIQELALAEEVMVIRGSVSLSWDILSQAIEALHASTYSTDAPHAIKTFAQWDQEKLAIPKFCRDLRHDIPTWGIFTAANLADRIAALLLTTNGLQATDPRDHLYALLGLVESPDEIRAEPSLNPDYTLPAERVLKNLAIYLLRTRKNLDILYGAGWKNPSLRANLPSWVPSWDSKRRGHLRQYYDPIYTLTHSPPNPAEFFLSSDEDVLSVKAFVIDWIEDIGSVADESEDLKYSSIISHARDLFKSWEEDCMMKMCEKLDQTVNDVLPLWLNTLFHENRWTDRNALEHFLYRLLMGHSSQSIMPGDDIERQLAYFCYMELNRLSGLAPFATHNGWIGLTEERVKINKGEIVCLFQGSMVPYILHNAGHAGYTLVGPCYMWSHMYDNPQIPATKSLEYNNWVSLV